MRIGTGVVLVAAALLIPLFAAGQEGEHSYFEAEGTIRVASSYVWRGLLINNDYVFQPELDLKFEPFSLNIWGNWDLKGEEESSARTRVDASLDYTVKRERMDVRGGVVIHAYHDDPGHQAKDTYEAFVDIIVDLPLYPSITVYYDFGTIEGFYAVFAVGHNHVLSEKAQLEFVAQAGAGSREFVRGFYGSSAESAEIDASTLDAGLVDVRVYAAVPWSVRSDLLLVPRVEFAYVVNSSLRDHVPHPENVVGSLAVTWLF